MFYITKHSMEMSSYWTIIQEAASEYSNLIYAEGLVS